LSDGAIDRGSLVGLFESVCQAVAYAHDHGVVHRDLKPGNVMVGAFGEVQVMDWGLAKVLVPGAGPAESTAHDAAPATATAIDSDRGEADATEAGSVLGTPAYMPPEQAIGAVDQIDARSDVFGLGAILCALLTGQPPYVGADFEAVRQMAARARLADAFARLDGCRADPGLVELVKRCLAAEPADRPPDAGGVARAVAGLRAAADERARQAELDRVRAEGERAKAEAEAREQRKRRRAQAALGLAFVALIVVAGTFAWWAREKRLAAAAEARDRQIAAEREVGRAVEAAAAAHAQAVGAGRDPALWAEARSAARQAVDLAAAADAPADVRERIGRLAAEVEQAEKNRRLIATLLEIRAGVGDQLDPAGMLDFNGTAARYERAFQEYGADPLALAPEAAADVLAALAGDARVDVAAAIDDWAYLRSIGRFLDQQRGPAPKLDLADRARHVGPLFEVTRRLDPDPVRNRLRTAIAASDYPTLVRLCQEIDPGAHPAQTINLAVLFLPWNEPWAREEAIRFLGWAQPHHPGDFHVNHNLAFFLLQKRNFADALPYAAAAVAVRPNSALAWHTWAVAVTWAGRWAEAAAAYRRAYTLSPQNLTARVSAAALWDRAGDRPAAAAVRAELDGLGADPAALGFAYFILGKTFQLDGYAAGAEAAFREAIRHKSAYQPLAFGDLARLLEQRGDLKGAMAVYQEGIEKVEKWFIGYNGLAWILAVGPDGLRNGPEAVHLATEACRMTNNQIPGLLDTLAAAYAETGDFGKAVEYQQKAAAAAAAAKRNGAEYRERLTLYEQKRPYRSPYLTSREFGPPPREVKP
ncbi:MAG TPA: protein kinase, partial [Gemmataceae bacterium]|nr:protein kinase [Gemmataceae bacterium]